VRNLIEFDVISGSRIRYLLGFRTLSNVRSRLNLRWRSWISSKVRCWSPEPLQIELNQPKTCAHKTQRNIFMNCWNKSVRDVSCWNHLAISPRLWKLVCKNTTIWFLPF
jgi:hypothetical protein